MPDAKPNTLRSNGEPAARGDASASLPPRTTPPPPPEERVVLTHPRRVVAPPTTAPAKRSGPRNPEQRTPQPPKAPAIDLPDGRPCNKTQRIIVDPDQLAEWDEEERRKNAR